VRLPTNGGARPAAQTGGALRAPDRRKTTQIPRNWDRRMRAGMVPPWRARADISTDGLEDYCVCGCFTDDNREIVFEEMGDVFSRTLNPVSDPFDAEIYPAAVLIGIITQLGATLVTKAQPILDEGKIPTPKLGIFLYRLVILPFATQARNVDRWMALGSWRPEMRLAS
jgi:hypothetical protein